MKRFSSFWLLAFAVAVATSMTLSSCNKDDDDDNQPVNNEQQNQGQTDDKTDGKTDNTTPTDLVSAAAVADEITKLDAGSHTLKVGGEFTEATLNSIGDALRTKYAALTSGSSTSKALKQTATTPIFAVELDLSATTGLSKLESGVSDDGATYSGLAGSQALTSLTLPSTLKEISANAVAHCLNLTTVSIPESVTTIADGAFFGCVNLKESDKFPNMKGTLVDADELKSVISEFTDGNHFIKVSGTLDGNNLPFFYGNSDFTLNLDLYATEIGKDIENQFCGSGDWLKGAQMLKSVILPHSLTKIEDWTFSACHNLVYVMIPKSVRSINSKSSSNGMCGAFFECFNLKNINIEDPYGWKNQDGNPIDKLTSDMLLTFLLPEDSDYYFYKD